jgi:amino acid transporter
MSDTTTGNTQTGIKGAGAITLKKDAIGLPEVLFQSITAMAPAAAVATALSPAIPFAGASLPLAVLLATIACAFIAACIGQLAIHIPSAGGMYTYISRSLGSRLGFMSAWTFLMAQPLLLPLVALIWGIYAETLIMTLTGIDIPWYIWSILGNIVESGLGGWVGIFQGMIFAFLAFVGFETAAPLGEETAHPKRNIPRAVVFSAIGIGLLYVLASYAGVNGWGIPQIQGYAASAAPWADLGKKFWGTVGPIIISFAILNSALGNGNSGINATSRVAYAMGRIGTLLPAFARLSKYQTPVVGILVHNIMSIIVSIGCGLAFGYANAYGLIGTVLTLGLLLLYIASCISTFFFYRRERPQDFRIGPHVIVPLIPLIILLAVVEAQVFPVPPYPLNLAPYILIVWLVIGFIYMTYLSRSNPAALERSKEIFLQDLESEPTGLVSDLL